jgi:hypothetical protein
VPRYATFALIVLAIAGIVTAAVVQQRRNTPATLADAANNFIASLTPEQAQKTMFAFEDEERFNWHFIPRERKGLPLREMTPSQKHLAHALLSAALSQRGYHKATTIMSLEEVLKVLENDSGERRNSEKYYFSLFGKPADKGNWAVRVEGHHLAMNFTVADNRMATTPLFMGANPAEVRQGPRKGLRVLSREEDLARALMTALTPEQRKVALVSETAYKDILTEASRKAALKGQPSGLSASKMTAEQRRMLDELLAEYVYNVPEDTAEKRLAQIKAAGSNLFFAWAGTLERGGPHYYRIQAPAFLIEYDNTQNNANHIHSVWRDYEGDFGLDMLKRHYATADHTHGHTHR